MNKLTTLLIFIGLQSSAYAQYSPNYDKKKNWDGLSMWNLKGKIKSFQQTCFLATDSSGVIKKGPRKIKRDQISVSSDCSIEFDNKGRIVKEAYYNLLGGDDETLNHIYNDAGKVEEITTAPSPKGEIYFTYIYKYDAKGRITNFFMSQWIGPGTYTVNKSAYKYDEKDNIAQRNYEYHNGVKLETKDILTYKYTSIGKETVQEQYNEKGSLRYKISHKKDDKGNIIETVYYTADCKSVEHVLKFKHDDYGNEVRKEYYTTGTNPVKTWSYKYEYDKQNNWIKRTDYENGKVVYILERELNYY